MVKEFAGVLKRQYANYKIFKAFSLRALLAEAFLLPRDLLSDSGVSSSVLNIALFITLRCNARCTMCNLREILNHPEMTDMPREKMERLLDEVAPHRPSIILFGGEPFLRKDFVDLVKSVKKRGLRVGIFTNGTLLNEEIAENLIGEGLDYIAFSLQGAGEVHDQIAAIPGAYGKMMKSVQLFTRQRRRRTKVILHTTICERNLDDLQNIAGLGLELGADLVRFGHPTFCSAEERERFGDNLARIFPNGAGNKAMSYVYDIGDQGPRYLAEILKLKSNFGNKIHFSPELNAEEMKTWYSPSFASERKCLFIWRSLFIYPNGDLHPCESISLSMGNVFEEGFDQVWNGPRYREFRRVLKKGLLPACARCCKL